MIAAPDAGPAIEQPPRLSLHRKFACPRCGALQYGPDLRGGELWYRCEVRRCRQTFLAIAIPPGTTGAGLALRIGPALAAEVVYRAGAAAVDCGWRCAALAPAGRPAYLMLAARPAEREACRFASLSQILRTLAPG